MRILYLAAHPIEGPSTRFRIAQFFPYLEANGIQPVLKPFFTSQDAHRIYAGPGGASEKLLLTAKSGMRRISDLLNSRTFDIVYVLREGTPYAPAFFEKAFRSSVGKMIFDFDDAIYHRSLVYNNPLDRLRDWNKTAKLIAASSHVIAGSQYLGDYASKHIASDHISVLPTVVDTNVFRLGSGSRGKARTVGWIGTPRGSAYLQDLMPCFRRLVDGFSDIQFLFVGAEPYDTEGLPIVFKPWRLEQEISDIQSFDIGLMPLTDDEETRGKCGFKLIEYMACGVAAVSSPVGENNMILTEGETGCFADSNDDWYEKIALLLSNSSMLGKLRRNGRDHTEKNYSLQAVAPRHLEILRNVHSQ